MDRFQKICLFAVVVTATTFAAGQEQKPEIKHAPAGRTSPASGQEMYVNYCAACHGKDGKGDGPAAPALKVAPADLTALTQKNSGKYPVMRVTSVLNGQANLAAHGNKEMPVWGKIFWQMSGGHDAEVQQRIGNLNKYLESIQAK
jgi:mono/diheme cytochrome c family protein